MTAGPLLRRILDRFEACESCRQRPGTTPHVLPDGHVFYVCDQCLPHDQEPTMTDDPVLSDLQALAAEVDKAEQTLTDALRRRDAVIREASGLRYTHQTIADHAGVNRQRVGQIVNRNEVG